MLAPLAYNLFFFVIFLFFFFFFFFFFEVCRSYNITQYRRLVPVVRVKSTLAISEKLKILERIKNGVSMPIVCEEFSIKKSTFYDIKKAKEKICRFALSREEGWEKKKPTVICISCNCYLYTAVYTSLYLQYTVCKFAINRNLL